jgi:Tfp pilus assembly protein PilF
MARMFARIDLMEGAASRTYRLVLERYPRNAKLLRSYGRFLENVRNDPWGASKYYAEAEKQVRRSARTGRRVHAASQSEPGHVAAGLVKVLWCLHGLVV